MAGRDAAVQKLWDDLLKAVNAANLDRRVVLIADRDPSIEPLIAVDYVVAATALAHVAAAATQQDVAAGEEIVGRVAHQVAKQLAQTLDPIHALLRQFVAEERGFVV